jgi:peptide/nickel transport system substrate-binding protein
VSQKQLFGPYRLEELIGRGGMGEVFRAYDTRRDRVVALKILPTAMAEVPEFVARFRQESQLIARLSAPHIIPIHDFGEIDGQLFLDMRLVRGVDLSTVLESGPLTPPRAVEMASQVASALDAAHTDGLVHRDVKPSNVLYVGDPREPIADEPDFLYLVDFGIARSLDATEGSALTATGHAVGTLGYMAPERFSGEPADRRVDVYALACTLYEALAGRPAFAGDGLATLMYAHLQRTPAAASTVNRAVPAALDPVLAKGMAKRADDRFQTAGELAEAARSAIRGEPGRRRTRPIETGRTDVVRGSQRAPVRAPAAPGSFPPVAPDGIGPPRPPAPGRRALQIGGAAVAVLAVVAATVVGVRALPDGGPRPAPAQGLAACGTEPLTCNGAEPQQLLNGGEVTMAIEADIANWNVNSTFGNLGAGPWVMNSVLPYTFGVGPDFASTRNPDLLTDAVQTDAVTVVYTINPAAVWNDGTPVSADDFVYNWRVRNGRDCLGCNTYPAGYENITDITGGRAADGAPTVTISFGTPYPEWQTLFAASSPLYPAHVAARHGDLSTPEGRQAAFDWFGQATPDYSAGPLTVQPRQPGAPIVLARNPRWYGRPARLDRVLLQVVRGATAQVSALRAGRVQVIAPTVGAGLTAELAGISGIESFAGASLEWERIDLNTATPALQDKALRQALFTAVDLDRVRAIGAEQFGRADLIGSHNFVPGQAGFTDVLASTGQGTGDVQAARQILTAAHYTGVGSALVAPNRKPVPALRAVYFPDNPARKRLADYLVESARALGVTITPTTAPDPLVEGNPLTTHDFDLVLYGRSNPPAQVANARQSWGTGGASNYGSYTNPTVDRLLAAAAASPDAAAAHDLLNQADQVMTGDAFVLPLYRGPSLLAVRRDVANVRDNPMLGPLYNVAEWGVRSGS